MLNHAKHTNGILDQQSRSWRQDQLPLAVHIQTSILHLPLDTDCLTGQHMLEHDLLQLNYSAVLLSGNVRSDVTTKNRRYSVRLQPSTSTEFQHFQ